MTFNSSAHMTWESKLIYRRKRPFERPFFWLCWSSRSWLRARGEGRRWRSCRPRPRSEASCSRARGCPRWHRHPENDLFVCFSLCLFVSFFVCLFVCLPLCLFVSLFVGLFVLFVSLFLCLSVRLSVCRPGCLFACLFFLSLCLFVC